VTAPALPPLSEWENFYVIIGSSAGALTGLMFVVIALAAEMRIANPEALKAFASPTIVHFCAVLLIAAFVSSPHQTIRSFSVALVVGGLAGIVYTSTAIIHARNQSTYQPVLSDWIWHGCLPDVGYAGLLAACFVLRRSPEAALDVVAGSALLLLFVGIHNAWDSAVWMTISRREREKKAPEAGSS
jgi:hypothetical protein